jgi:replicative DNA helicase
MPRDAVPPHDLDAERLILSCFNWQPTEAAKAIVGLVEPDDLYHPAHRHILTALLALIEQGVKPDPVTLRDELANRGLLGEVGGVQGIAAATTDTAGSTGNMPRYASIVTNLSARRRLLAAAETIRELAWDVHESAESAQQALALVQEVVDATNKRVRLRGLDEMLEDYMNLLEARQLGEGLGIPTGWRDLDAITGGMREGELIVVGARPAVGKSTFAGNLAVNVIKQGKRVLLVSIEMAETEVIERIVAAEARVHLKKLRMGDLTGDTWSKITGAADALSGKHLTILDDPNATIESVRAAGLRTGTELIIVDYTQLMRTEERRHGTRENEVADLTGGMKRMARELRCPVMALSQVKRDADGRRPELSDMAESSSFEKNANVVIGLYREELVSGGRPGMIEVIVLKSRNTVTGSALLGYLGHHQRIDDLPPEPERAFERWNRG